MPSKILEISNLTKRFSEQDTLSNIDIDISSGEIVAVMGQPGSGRSTLLKLAAGLMAPTSGNIRINGSPVLPGSRQNIRFTGLLLKEHGIYQRLNVQQYLEFFRKLFNVSEERVDYLIGEVGLIDRKKELLKNFSPNFTARVEIARVMLHNPSLLLLDEPTSGLDLETLEILRRLIIKTASQGTGILITTSSYEEAAVLAHKSAKLVSGKLEAWEFTENNANDASKSQASDSTEFRTINFKLEKIPAKVNDKIILFNPTELTYIESREGQAVLHAGTDEFPCPLTLAELEERLKPIGFFRSHRSYIVNLQRVREVIPWTRNSYSLVLDDPQKTTIPLSKNSMKELEDFLGM